MGGSQLRGNRIRKMSIREAGEQAEEAERSGGPIAGSQRNQDGEQEQGQMHHWAVVRF